VDGLLRLGADPKSPASDIRRSASTVGASAVREVCVDLGLKFDPSRSSTSNTMKDATATQTIEIAAHQAAAFNLRIADAPVALGMIVLAPEN
jgi:hypothetical protein